MSNDSIDLISAGHICVDIAPQFIQAASECSVERVFRPGALTVVGPAAVSAGGGAANVGLAAQRLGLNLSLMGKCGDDLLGQTLLQVLERASPQCAAGMRISPGEHTGYTVALAVPGVDRLFLHFPGANDTFTAGDSAVAGLLAALLREADLPTAADYACAVGAQSVQAVDPVSGVRTWEQTTAQLSGPRVPPAVVLD